MLPLESIRKAAKGIGDRIIRTPLVFSPSLSRMFDIAVYLKLENLQKTGSFKIRGATHKLMAFRDRIGPEGVVAASAGNHAQGVALAARQAGVPATIVMPEWASITKQEATRAYGGEVIIHGQTIEACLEHARELAAQGRTFIHPFNDAEVITGQGTLALEIFEDLPAPDLILVPVGGGGLIAGISAVAAALQPKTRIVGVQAAACPSAFEAWRQNRVVRVAASPSIADGINVKEVGELTFRMMRQSLGEVVLVDEEQIAAAILMLLEMKKTLAEGAGAVPLAALLGGAVRPPKDSRVVLVISGGNLDSPLLGRIIAQGLIKHGRVMRLCVRLKDVPGSLARLLSAVSRLQANVLHIRHERSAPDLPIFVTRVELELETRGPAHVAQIAARLREEGYDLEGAAAGAGGAPG
jgi:threonine dehydratase